MRAISFKTTRKHTIEDKKRVLTKALINMTERLKISRQELSAIIGLSESTLSRIFAKADYYVDPASKEGQLAILFLRLYRSLDVLFGGNAKQCQQWLRSDNTHLNNQPINLLQSIEGIVLVIQYLDAMRGKN